MILLLACAPEDTPPATPPLDLPDAVTLPGDDFFPEGLGLGADGTLYIGSITTGALAVAAPGEAEATVLIPAGGFGDAGIMGVEVEPATGLVWFCTADPRGGAVSALRAWDPAVPAEVHAFAFQPDSFCNDVTIGPDGTVYASDSDGGGIAHVLPDRSAMQRWSYDEELYNPGRFALNGVVAHQGSVFLGRFDTGELLQFDAAGAFSVLAAGVGAIDGLDADGDGLIAVDGQGKRLVRVELGTGAQQVLAEGLDGPTTLEVDGDHVWVVEGQLQEREGTPDLPFQVVRIDL